jgi:hypothetical protein
VTARNGLYSVSCNHPNSTRGTEIACLNFYPSGCILHIRLTFSDDPDASEKLIDKLERLKKRQEMIHSEKLLGC